MGSLSRSSAQSFDARCWWPVRCGDLAQGHLTLGGDAGDTLDDRLIIGSVQSVLEAYGAYKALRGGR